MCDGPTYYEEARMAHGHWSRWLGSYWPAEDTGRDEETVEDTPVCAVCGMSLLPSELVEGATVCGPCQQEAPPDPDQNALDF
jgi:hypothetical protein